eukprot:CAMPEP_0202489542 /NCGR_PEP_ID=MMETSP1361-20130828/7237_1 /ASSEMBLY_ACC=CAM_ASM_000849 /TAXON_ID=210615 /ORGANISM="Staurosira complex sp., Strain CCMP2646" /LENGTH=336 /DNA_ID=CAMNT_0049119297 /DNA_START=22 /DNA_END=1032 /DNA_ORIENTATION=-
MSDRKDDEMTPEERTAWLRERGVLIETPEERKAQSTAPLALDGSEDVITFVKIPADTSKPLEELSFPVSANQTGDALAEHLKPLFGSNAKNIDMTLFEKQAATQLLSTDATVSPEALAQVAQEGNVETFTLVHALPSNHFTGINIYLDEVGMLKRLPLNTRAGSYAARAGFNPEPQFYGDVYMGRVKTKPALTNVSFTLGKDTSPEAPWLQKATMENLEYQKQFNEFTGRSELQKAVDGTDGVAKAETGYEWTQTDEELEVVVPLPKGVTSKDVDVKYLPKSLEVKCKKEPMVVLPLFARVDPDGCTWTLDRDGGETKLVITMEKTDPVTWPRITV